MKMLNIKKSNNDRIQPEINDTNNIWCYDYKIGTRKKTGNLYNKTAKRGATSSGIYTKINALRNKCLPTPPCKQPFPFVFEKNGCFKEYLTPEEAKDDNLLPEDWLKCSTVYPTYHKYNINPYE